MNFNDKKAAVMEVLRTFDLDSSAVWNCHGTPVILHKALETVQLKAGISFDMPTIIQADAGAKIAVICVSGSLGERTEWSMGEAMPSNNKNSYPFAMAEKRGKDRVILKLINLHGLAYSEDEADDFKSAKSTNNNAPKRRSKSDCRDDYAAAQKAIDDAPDMTALIDAWKSHWPKIQTMPVDFEDEITQRKDDKKHELSKLAS